MIMKRGAWLRRRFKLVKGQFSNMFKRRDSAVALDDDAVDAVDAVAQHRAEAEAKLEGKIKPLIPTSQDTSNASTPRRRTSRMSRAARMSGQFRDSIRNSQRLSFVGEQFAMSAVTAGCGQGLGWSMIEVQTPQQQEEQHIAAHQSLFREDGGDHHSRPVFSRSAKGRSRFRYSMLDPSMGLGEAAVHQNNADAAYSEQANYIRVMMESGNFDLHQFGLNKDAIEDPNFQTALHAALESFPPGMAAQIIEASAELHEDDEQKDAERPVSSLRKSRFSIAIAGKTAWHDLRSASHRWSRANPNMVPVLRCTRNNNDSPVESGHGCPGQGGTRVIWLIEFALRGRRSEAFVVLW
jgi:hypothetical protein